jgi:hypothetical protein
MWYNGWAQRSPYTDRLYTKGKDMGRYSRTVRCRHCFNEGHNVKSCSALTKEVAENVNGYYHRRYRKYFNDDGTRKKDSAVKKCSYCNEPGHTKRTCDVKLDDMIYNVKINSLYRKDMLNFLKTKGLGIGSLITLHKSMYLVTGFRWDDFVCGDNRWDKAHLEIMPVTEGSYRKFAIDDYIIKYDQNSIKVDSPEYNIEEPPESWLSGRSTWYSDFKGRITNPFDKNRSAF